MVEIHEPEESSVINNTQNHGKTKEKLSLNFTSTKSITSISPVKRQIPLTPTAHLDTNTDCGGEGGGDRRESKVKMLAEFFELSTESINKSQTAMKRFSQKMTLKSLSPSTNSIGTSNNTTVIAIHANDDGDDSSTSPIDYNAESNNNLSSTYTQDNVSMTSSMTEPQDNLTLPYLKNISITSSLVTSPEEGTSSMEDSKDNLTLPFLDSLSMESSLATTPEEGTSSMEHSKDNLTLPFLDSLSVESSLATTPEEGTSSPMLEYIKSASSFTSLVMTLNHTSKKVLKTDFPTEYRFHRKRKPKKWGTIAKHFNIGIAKEEAQKPPVVVKKKEKEEVDRTKMTEAIRKMRENRQLTCIMLGLMIEAELPPKFYEMIGRSESIRTMLWKLVQTSKSKECILNLFEDNTDGGDTAEGKSADQDHKTADAGGKNADRGNVKHSVILLENDDDDVFVDNFKTAEELV